MADLSINKNDWKKCVSSILGVVTEIDGNELKHHSAEDVKASIDNCLASFDKDFVVSCNKLQRFLSFEEYEGDRSKYATSIKNTLAEWQAKGGPSILSLIAAWYKLRGYDACECKTVPYVKASFAAGVLAGIPLPASSCKGYHESAHFREVALFNMLAISGEEYINSVRFPINIAARQVMLAAAHDLFHTGKDNTRNGKYHRYYMEQRSFEAFKPYMVTCGLSCDEIRDVHIGILITDIVKGEDRDFAAHQFLRKVYLYHFEGGEKPKPPAELQRLLSPEESDVGPKGREITLMCIRLQESDTLSSSLDEDSFEYRFLQLRAENPEKYQGTPSIESFVRFIKYIFTNGEKFTQEKPELLSPFFRAWFQERLEKVYDSALKLEEKGATDGLGENI